MIIPNIWENKKWQPNHQPDIHVVFSSCPHLDGPWGQLFMNFRQSAHLSRDRKTLPGPSPILPINMGAKGTNKLQSMAGLRHDFTMFSQHHT